MAFTCPSKTDITSSQLGEVYTPSVTGGKKLLPSSVSSTERDSTTGLLVPTALAAIISSLETDGTVPDPKKGTPSTYRARVKKLLEGAKNEYCFYDSRYRYSLEYLFSGIKSMAASTSSSELQQVVNTRLETAQTLNRKVNDLIQIMNAITEKMLSSSRTLQAEIDAFNTKLRAQRDKLEEQNKIIHSNEATMRIQKEMVKYTEEKSRYSDNLLKMYSFLNIVALGLLVYVYKAAGDNSS
jgi:hypothetical protein